GHRSGACQRAFVRQLGRCRKLAGAAADHGGAVRPWWRDRRARAHCWTAALRDSGPAGDHRERRRRRRVGSARGAKAAADGYQFVLGSRADAINQTLYKNPLYNFATDLAPVVLIADQPTLLVARKDLPAADLREFIAYARANQTKMQMASAGAGS